MSRFLLPIFLLIFTAALLPPAAADELPRPRVLLTPEKLLALREEVRVAGWKRDVYLQTIRANADRWVGRSIRIPDRGGWIQDLVCTDGSMLLIPEEQDFGTTSIYTCPACGAEYRGAKFDAARRRLEHEWLMGAALDLSLAGLLEEDDRYLRKCAEILLRYADAKFPGHKPGTPGGIFKQSLNDAVAIIWLAQAYDLLASTDVLSRESRERIERDVFWESAEGLTRCGLKGNWGSWHLSAIGVIGLATAHPRYTEFAEQAFRMQMANELGPDGLWPESVHGYHFYALRAFVEYAEAAANCGTDLYHYEARPGQGLRSMFAAPMSFMYPNLDMPAINDGFLIKAMPFDQYEVAWARYSDPQFGWLLKQRPRTLLQRPRGAQSPSAIWALVHGDPLPDNSATPEFGSTNFDHLGICVLRNSSTLPLDKQIMLTFDYGRMLGHGQFDKMGFTLFGNGRILMADYGTPAYGSAISPFYRGPLSHNTVMLKGGHQNATTCHGLVYFQDDPELKAACAQTTEALPGTEWKRTVILDVSTSEPHVLVIDELESTAPVQFDWSIHCEGDRFTLEDLGDWSRGPAVGHYSYLADLKVFPPTETAVRAAWRFRDGSGLTLVTASGAATQVSTACFPAETAARRVSGLLLSRDTERTTYAVVLKPYSTQAAALSPTIQMLNRGNVTLNDGRTRRVYSLTPTGVRVTPLPGGGPD